MKLEFEEITESIIGAAFEVHSELGYGFLEKVYQKALLVELGLRGLDAKLEEPIEVIYKTHPVGEYFADLLVEDKVIVELKVSRQYNPADEAQLINELKATYISVGLLVNFGREKIKFKRLIFSS